MLSTINRTLKSYALAIVAAEYVLGGCRAARINGNGSSRRTNSRAT